VPPELSTRTQGQIEVLFDAEERDAVSGILRDQCGGNLPLLDETDERDIERIRTAALKMSEGDLEKLRKAVAVARSDWRDLLVAAGFGHDPLADTRWEPGGDS
jgi:hypothetical protein